MKEIWKDVKGYEGLYEISNKGRVYFHCKGGGIKRTSLDNHGYHRTTLTKDRRKTTFLIHQLVALNFIPNPDNLPQINHIDFVKTNNNVENLEWCDGFYNMQHRKRITHYGNKAVVDLATGVEYMTVAQLSRAIKKPASTLYQALREGKQHKYNFDLKEITCKP